MYNNYSKPVWQIFSVILFTFSFIGCKECKIIQTGTILTFRKELSKDISNFDFFREKIIIPLEIKENALVDNNPSIVKDGEYFFIYSRNTSSPILRYNINGNFINSIGNKGVGPNEYTEILDIIIDEKKQSLKVLSYNSIIHFSYDGMPIKNEKIDISASSFTSVNNYYWFYTGNDNSYSDNRLFQTDTNFNIIKKYLSEKSNMFPMMEYNFKQSPYNTFRESFYNNIYCIKEDTLSISYTVKFPDMEFPAEAHNISPMEVIEYLGQHHYALIMCYLENDNYIYMQVSENNIASKQLFYHWIINKKNGEEYVINTDFIIDSYLISPQILSNDNKLYFLGYLIEDEKAVYSNENPSIVIINLP